MVWGILSPLIPAGQRRAPLDAPGWEAKRLRHGLVPDLAMELPPDLGGDATAPPRKQLGEVKTIHHCPTHDVASNNNPGIFGAAVKRRAEKIAREYKDKARRLDTEFGLTPDGADGPCLSRLLTFGAIAAFVFGAAGEVSRDFDRWVASVAAVSAARMSRLIGARTTDQARGCIAWRLRRKVGWVAINAAASLKIDRCEFVGPGGAQAAKRRAAASRDSRQARNHSWQNAARVDRDERRARQRFRPWGC